MTETIEQKIAKFPKGTRITIETMFDEREYKTSFTYKGKMFIPGSPNYFGLSKSLDYAYSAFCAMFPGEGEGVKDVTVPCPHCREQNKALPHIADEFMCTECQTWYDLAVCRECKKEFGCEWGKTQCPHCDYNNDWSTPVL